MTSVVMEKCFTEALMCLELPVAVAVSYLTMMIVSDVLFRGLELFI